MRLVVWHAAMVAALMFAGCTEPPASNEGAEDEVPEQKAGLQEFTGSFDLLIFPDPEVIGVGGTNENCVFFWDTDGAHYYVVGGNATLTWDPLPTTETMRLRVNGVDGPPAPAVGSSPLTLEFTPMDIYDWGIGLWADYSVLDATMPIAQTATLDVHLVYEGVLPEPRTGACSGGGV